MKPEERIKYSRQIALHEIGEAGQQKLSAASVMVVGAGGLGCPVLSYLAAAGVGKLAVVDGDRLELSNLHRQVIYSTDDIGKNKSELAVHFLRRLNPDLHYESISENILPSNALSLLAAYDIVLDCTDNPEARSAISKACKELGKVMVYASIYKFQGQLAVFDFKDGTSYESLFPGISDSAMSNCESDGILGVTAGIIGCMQAAEVLKIILGIGNPVSHGLLHYDVKSNNIFKINNKKTIDKNKEKRNLTKIYKEMEKSEKNESGFIALQAEDLLEKMIAGFDTQIIDLRNPGEEPVLEELNTIQIPLADLQNSFTIIDAKPAVVLMCQSGQRSRQAADMLCEKYQSKKLIYHLDGGIKSLLKVLNKEKHSELS